MSVVGSVATTLVAVGIVVASTGSTIGAAGAAANTEFVEGDALIVFAKLFSVFGPDATMLAAPGTAVVTEGAVAGAELAALATEFASWSEVGFLLELSSVAGTMLLTTAVALPVEDPLPDTAAVAEMRSSGVMPAVVDAVVDAAGVTLLPASATPELATAAAAGSLAGSGTAFIATVVRAVREAVIELGVAAVVFTAAGVSESIRDS